MSAPEEIHNVSTSQFSVARHFGGCKFQGRSYHYDADRDVLVRLDVWMARIKAGKAEAMRIRKAEREKWLAAQESLL